MTSSGPGSLGTDLFLCLNSAGNNSYPILPLAKARSKSRLSPLGTSLPQKCPGRDMALVLIPQLPLHPLHPLTPCPRGQLPTSVPPWQSRGVEEARKETERGMRDRQTDRDGGEGGDGWEDTWVRAWLMGEDEPGTGQDSPRSKAQPMGTPLVPGCPRASRSQAGVPRSSSGQDSRWLGQPSCLPQHNGPTVQS